MKHIAGETGTRSVGPETVHPSTISDASSHSGATPPTRRFTANELRNLPRPPGDYSWLENKLSDFYRHFLLHGILPEHWDDLEILSAFCTDNKLADALSYLCVKANLKELKIASSYSECDRVGFICSWAQNIDFEIALAFGQLESDQTSFASTANA